MRDGACDGHGVYLEVRADTFGWSRLTSNVPGGCKTSAGYRGNKWHWRDIRWGQIRICQDDWGWSTCARPSRTFG